MLGIIVLICCILCGFCVGLFLQRRRTEKVAFVEDLLKYIDLFRVNVLTGRKTVQAFDKEFLQACGKPFAEYKSGVSMPSDKLVRMLADEFFDGVKSVNNSVQLLRHLDYYKAKTDGVVAELTKNADKQKGLYVKLGLLLGAMIGLLFL